MVTTRIRVGDELGARYTVGGVAGRGGVGVVHTATDRVTGGPVLVTVPYARVRSALHPAGFAAASAAATGVRHPGLVPLLDAGVDDGTPYFVTDTVTGRSLAALLEEGALPLRRAVAIGCGVAAALAAAHAAGLVHRAIRPASIAVANAEHRDPGPAVSVLDLGVADLFRTPYFTLYPRIFGTAGYVSPEQIWNAAVGPATDVYALGLVLIEAITGAPVFPGTTAEEAKLRVIAAAPIPTDLPEDLRGLLGAMTALEPADRPAAAEVADRLTALRHGSLTAPIAVVPSPMPALRPSPMPAVRSDRGVAALTTALGRSGDGARAAAGRSVLTARVAVTARLRGLPLPAHVGRRVAIGSGGLAAAAAIVLAAALLPGAGSGVRAPLAEAAVTDPTPEALAPVATAAGDPAPSTLADRVTGARPAAAAALVPVAVVVTPVRTTPTPVPTPTPTPVPSDSPTAVLPLPPTPSAIATTPPAGTPPAVTPPADTPPADTPPADTPPADTPPADTPAPAPVAAAPAPPAPVPAAPQPDAPAATPPGDPPAAAPSAVPTAAPSTAPTTDPSAAPPVLPIALPSDAPTALPLPTDVPTLDPSAIPVPLVPLLPGPGA